MIRKIDLIKEFHKELGFTYRELWNNHKLYNQLKNSRFGKLRQKSLMHEKQSNLMIKDNPFPTVSELEKIGQQIITAYNPDNQTFHITYETAQDDVDNILNEDIVTNSIHELIITRATWLAVLILLGIALGSGIFFILIPLL